MAFIGDLHLQDAALGELARKRAEFFGQFDERLQFWGLFRRDRGEIDGVGDRPAQQIVRHLLGNLKRDILLRLGGGRTQMRRADNVGMPEQHVRGSGLLDEHIERGTCNLLGIERFDQRLLVDQAAARAIDDADALFHFRQRRGVDDVFGLLGQRGV